MSRPYSEMGLRREDGGREKPLHGKERPIVRAVMFGRNRKSLWHILLFFSPGDVRLSGSLALCHFACKAGWMEPWETTLEPAVVPSRLRGRMEKRDLYGRRKARGRYT